MKKILIVDDNAIAMYVEKALMESLDCQVDSALTGEEAVELAERNQYDLILMDLGLPGIDGIEATRKIRVSEAENHRDLTPIIAVTGNADKSQHRICMDAGMNAVIVKPLQTEIAKSILLDFDQLTGNLKTKLEP